MYRFENELFKDGEALMRVLAISEGRAWCIDVNNPSAWPIDVPLNGIIGLPSVEPEQVSNIDPSPARLRKRDEAMKRLQPLLSSGVNLFLPDVRHHAILMHAESYGCSFRTLYKDLRRWWQRGQTEYALLPEYDKSGKPSVLDGEERQQFTAGRGRPSRHRKTYQITESDIPKMRDAIDNNYLTSKEVTLGDSHKYLQANHYWYEDGNQHKHLNPQGEFPSYRQLLRFLHSHYDIESVSRARNGNADFELNERSRLGTIEADCRGIGHYFEIDATIGDIYLVSREDRVTIIGKPTIYTIRDRYSRLFVGFYFGLENPSWNGALQAILSISEDKEALCARYNVEYKPEHWPAHAVFPAEFLGDRGEMISYESNKVADNIHSIITNTPSKRADWKSTVEFGFKQIHATMRPIAPAYEPPLNAIRRRGKNYEKDACLTVDDFGNLFLNALITLNRMEAKGYRRTPAQVLENASTSPIALWNDDVQRRSGQLRKYSENFVRVSLLRRAKAKVTDKGVLFKGCYYSFPEAEDEGWFVAARRRRFELTVAYDTRLCDAITIFSRDGRKTYCASLTQASAHFKGYSFEEVRYIELRNSAYKAEAGYQNDQAKFYYRQITESTVAQAKTVLAELPRKTRSGRKADTKDAREAERVIERQKTVAPKLPPASPILHLASFNSEPVTPSPASSSANTSLKARIMAARNRIPKKDI